MNHAVILNQSEIDQALWTELTNFCNGSVYSSFKYLSVCGESWEALIFINNSKYICATPIQFRIKYGIKYIYQSPFVPFYEILNRGDKASRESFMQDLNIYLSSNRYVAKYFLRDSEINTLSSFRIIEEKGYHLSLNRDYKDILKTYSKDRKMRLKQAKRRNQDIIKSEDLELFLTLHEQFTLPKMHLIEKWQYTSIREFYRNLVKWSQLEILFCVQNNKVLGGLVALKHLSTIYYFDSFSTQDGRKHSSISLLLDYIIQKYSQKYYEFLDLGLKGTEGIEDFKGSFGAESYKIYQLYKNSLPWYIKIPKAILNYFGVATVKK